MSNRYSTNFKTRGYDFRVSIELDTAGARLHLQCHRYKNERVVEEVIQELWEQLALEPERIKTETLFINGPAGRAIEFECAKENISSTIDFIKNRLDEIVVEAEENEASKWHPTNRITKCWQDEVDRAPDGKDTPRGPE